jgi:hypothetical protein
VRVSSPSLRLSPPRGGRIARVIWILSSGIGLPFGIALAFGLQYSPGFESMKQKRLGRKQKEAGGEGIFAANLQFQTEILAL